DYPRGLQLILTSLAMFSAIFLGSIDNSTTPTLVPRITDQFHSLADDGWFVDFHFSYLLATAAFQLLFGKLYSVFSIKWVYVATIGLFELGSLICGVSPTSTALIIGRAVVGLGNAGIIAGSWVIISRIVPLQKRPIYTGALIAVYGITGIVGPLLGGLFTDKLSWRWAYYVNLLIGAVTLLMVIISCNSKTLGRKSKLVYVGRGYLLTHILVPGIISLLLALRWGGSTYRWNGRVEIALFILSGLLISIFIGLQIWKQDQATVPPRIVKQRSIFAGAAFLMCLTGSHNVLIYYLPIYFQAIQGVAATSSAIYGLPLIVSVIPASIISGVAVTVLGYYTPFIILSSILVTVGTGLLSTFTVHTRPGQWIGFQAIYGLGVGVGTHQPIVAAQTVLSQEDIPLGMAPLVFFQTLGGAVFVSVAQNVFTNRLRAGLISQVPGVNPATVLSSGAANLRSTVDPEFLSAVRVVYNEALVSAIQVALGLACLSFVGAFIMEWKSVK
ncbi:major facilitator superfamily protein, partial [Mycena sanguinolenta]